MSQAATDLIKRLRDHGLRVFTTADLITLTGMKPVAATQALRRLGAKNLISPLKRGVWANLLARNLNPFEAVPSLTSPWTGYVSLYSALSHYGLIDEVPPAVYAVYSGRAQRLQTPLGEFRLHQIPARLLWGFKSDDSGPGSYLMAEPEKAFLDLAYLGLIPRSPLGLPYQRDHKWSLDRAKLLKYARRFQFPPLMKYLRANNLAPK